MVPQQCSIGLAEQTSVRACTYSSMRTTGQSVRIDFSRRSLGNNRFAFFALSLPSQSMNRPLSESEQKGRWVVRSPRWHHLEFLEESMRIDFFRSICFARWAQSPQRTVDRSIPGSPLIRDAQRTRGCRRFFREKGLFIVRNWSRRQGYISIFAGRSHSINRYVRVAQATQPLLSQTINRIKGVIARTSRLFNVSHCWRPS